MLSEVDREIIKGNIRSYDPYDFTYELEKRIYELLEDLKLIHDDKYGVTNELKSRIGFNLGYKKENWIASFPLIEIITIDFNEELYINEFRRYRKNKNYLYWLNLVSDSVVFKKDRPNYLVQQKARKPQFMFGRLYSVKNDEGWLKKEGAILLECYTKIKELLPTTREDAKSINELKKYLAEPDKYLEWNREQNKMTLSEFKKENPLDYDNWVNTVKFKNFLKNRLDRIELKTGKKVEQNTRKVKLLHKKELLKLENEIKNKFIKIIPKQEMNKILEKLKVQGFN